MDKSRDPLKLIATVSSVFGAIESELNNVRGLFLLPMIHLTIELPNSLICSTGVIGKVKDGPPSETVTSVFLRTSIPRRDSCPEPIHHRRRRKPCEEGDTKVPTEQLRQSYPIRDDDIF